MPTTTKTVGATGRDYATTVLAEADTDNAAVFTAGDDEVFEMYNDATFDEALTINAGATLPANSITFRAASGQGHNGTAGTGVRWVITTVIRPLSVVGPVASRPPTTVSHVEMNLNGLGPASAVDSGGLNAMTFTFARFIVHNGTRSAGDFRGITMTNAVAHTENYLNGIIYNLAVTGVTNRIVNGINLNQTAHTINVMNVTVDTITNNTTAGTATGILAASDAGFTVKNCVATNTGGTSSGALLDFSLGALVVDTNLASEDTTATGTGSITGLTPANEFVAVGSDYHLKSGAQCINAGADLVTTPTGVNIDIDGRDRDAQGDTWDIGADELVASVSTSVVQSGIVNNITNSKIRVFISNNNPIIHRTKNRLIKTG